MDFPDELWLEVVSYLDFPELGNLALSSHRFFDLCKAQISKLDIALKTKYTDIVHELGIWSKICLQVVDGSLPPKYVRQVTGPAAVEPVLDPATDEEWEALSDYYGDALTEEEEERVMKAAKQSIWIREDDDFQEIRQGINTNDDDILFSILLPLLPKLQHLILPFNLKLLLRVMDRIVRFGDIVARCEGNVKSPFTKLSAFLPFQELHLVVFRGCDAFDGYYGIELYDLIPFMALPKMQKIVACRVTSPTKQKWPSDLPKSRVAQVQFEESDISLKAIKRFAKYIGVPCLITQDWDWDEHMPDSWEWDEYRISGIKDPSTGFILPGTRKEKKHRSDGSPY